MSRAAFPTPAPGEQAKWGHAIVAVGYDDKKKVTNTKCNKAKTGAFLIRHSWGIAWGDHDQQVPDMRWPGYGKLESQRLGQQSARSAVHDLDTGRHRGRRLRGIRRGDCPSGSKKNGGDEGDG